MEDPLDDTGLVQQQLDQLSTIGRCEYEKTCALLVQLFDQSAQSYQELLQSATASPMDVAVQEGEHLWGTTTCKLAVGCPSSKVLFQKPAFLVNTIQWEARPRRCSPGEVLVWCRMSLAVDRHSQHTQHCRLTILLSCN